MAVLPFHQRHQLRHHVSELVREERTSSYPLAIAHAAPVSLQHPVHRFVSTLRTVHLPAGLFVSAIRDIGLAGHSHALDGHPCGEKPRAPSPPHLACRSSVPSASSPATRDSHRRCMTRRVVRNRWPLARRRAARQRPACIRCTSGTRDTGTSRHWRDCLRQTWRYPIPWLVAFLRAVVSQLAVVIARQPVLCPDQAGRAVAQIHKLEVVTDRFAGGAIQAAELLRRG